MSQAEQFSLVNIGKIVGISALTLIINYLATKQFSNKKNQKPEKLHILQEQHSKISERKIEEVLPNKTEHWGSLSLRDIPEEDDLLKQLDIMSKIICPVQKVNNLIVDLKLNNFKTFPCPLLAKSTKLNKGEPFLFRQSLVRPCEFVIQNCVFRAGQTIECEKKFMRAGPRSTQYFNSSDVRADIVCCGKVAPGINNLIRQLVILLKEVYKVQRVSGIRYSFKGYTDNIIIDLQPQLVKTIHHHGGCYLGLSTTPFDLNKVIDSLVQRQVNQLYLIGGNDTLRYSHLLYNQIRRRGLNIALCVNLKAINKDIAFFDTCFGFQSAVEETQRFIQEGYAISKSNFNSVVMIKVPGRFSGFLAMDAVRAARNANICLVPQFAYDLYGKKGVLSWISQRIRAKGYCILVYSEGAAFAARDVDRVEENTKQYGFDLFLKQQIQKELQRSKFNPFNVYFFDTQNAVRTVPANAFDTKLCCQVALCSIQGLMCGYTNFAIGHLKNRVAMVPIEQMNINEKFCLKPHEENWLRLLANTGQSSFLNDRQ